jgi:hypothetical protein
MRLNRTAPATTGFKRRVWLVRDGAGAAPAVCASCERPAQMLTQQEAAAFSGSDAQTVASLLKLGKLHGNLSAEGLTLVCLNSLL